MQVPGHHSHWIRSYCQKLSSVTTIVANKKNFKAPFYGWASTASRLKPLRGGSLLFTSKFPEIAGTRLIDIERMKDWVDLGATQWFWTRDPWIGNPAPYEKGFYRTGHSLLQSTTGSGLEHLAKLEIPKQLSQSKSNLCLKVIYKEGLFWYYFCFYLIM